MLGIRCGEILHPISQFLLGIPSDGKRSKMGHGRPAKRRKVSPPTDHQSISETIRSTDLFHRAAEWDLEQDYEKRSRSNRQGNTTKLPIKTAEGRVEHRRERTPQDDESDSFLGTNSESGQDGADTPPTEETDEPPQIPVKHQILAAKEELARIAALMNEDTEAHVGSFKKLAGIGGSTAHPTIKKLVLATQLAVYKDVIPGYRIRAYKDEDVGTKVSKEVRQTRQYEQALVAGYQQYVEELASIMRAGMNMGEAASLKLVATSCACALLLAVPHFNFRTELLRILIGQLSSRHSDPYFDKCVQTFEEFFDSDDDGAPSLEAVSLLTKMMRARDYRIQERVLDTLFHLRLLSELSAKSSMSKTDKPDGTPIYRGKKLKSKWEPRSKKERKLARERKAVEKDFKEADATVTHQDRDRMQSETLRIVFVTYFRILKLGTPHLMGAVLEGLAKFAHLINQEFFGDLLEALKDIVSEASATESDTMEVNDSEEPAEEGRPSRNMTRESLLSTQTAFTLLSGQDVSKSASALHLDLSFFTSHIYKSLHQLSLDADIELGPKSLRLSDPHASSTDFLARKSQSKVNVSTPMLLLTRAMTSILLTPSAPPPTITVLAFCKRLLTTSLQLPEKSTMALLSLMSKVAQKHGRKIEALWYSDERKGDGNFHGESENIEGTNALALGSGVWESELLRHHFSPQVRKEVVDIDKLIQGLNR
jgi:nucleolar complex protein 3